MRYSGWAKKTVFLLFFVLAILFISWGLSSFREYWVSTSNEIKKERLVSDMRDKGFYLVEKKEVQSYDGECGDAENRVVNRKRFGDSVYIFCKID